MNFTLIIAFRERIELLLTMLKTLVENSANINLIEVFLAIDNDDQITLNSIPKIKAQYPFVHFFVNQQSIYFTRDYINPLAKLARGRFVINGNDDMEFVTKGWDRVVYDRMHEASLIYGDEIMLGIVKDGLIREGDQKKPDFSCWPIVSKKSIEYLGYFVDEAFYVWGVDQILAQLYRKIDRVVYMTDVLIAHNSGHANRRPFDKNHAKFCEIHRKYPATFTIERLNAEADRLMQYIERKKNI